MKSFTRKKHIYVSEAKSKYRSSISGVGIIKGRLCKAGDSWQSWSQLKKYQERMIGEDWWKMVDCWWRSNGLGMRLYRGSWVARQCLMPHLQGCERLVRRRRITVIGEASPISSPQSSRKSVEPHQDCRSNEKSTKLRRTPEIMKIPQR